MSVIMVKYCPQCKEKDSFFRLHPLREETYQKCGTTLETYPITEPREGIIKELTEGVK